MLRTNTIISACIGILFLLLVGACGNLPPPESTHSPTPAIEASHTVQATDRPLVTRHPTVTKLPTPTPAPTATATEPAVEAGMESALVMQVLDGDTIEVMIGNTRYRLRYTGIDAPEDGQAYSAEAEAMNRRLVEGKKVLLEKDVSETDVYDRLLRYVYLPDGTFVNAELLKAGLAQAVAYEPDTLYQQFFEQLQAEAIAKGAGMWGQPESTATPPAEGAGVFIDPACSQFDAPGNDNDNKIEEYVCVANQSASALDLSGWVVEDSYGWQYTFPVFILEAGANVRVRTGCGADSTLDLHWCRDETAIWNNGGDCAYLLDSQQETIHQYCY